eukprot:jgi/Botrbrau1/10576/Bobra.0343s0024.1
MIERILPFHDPLVEQEFKITYHKRRILLDLCVALFAIILVPNSYIWESVLVKKMYILVCVSEILIIACIFHPSYPLWRLHVMIVARVAMFGSLFYSGRAHITKFRAPTFRAAAFYTLLELSRGKMPFLFATMFQISLTEAQVPLQTALLAFLMSQAKQECGMMTELNDDFALFARQLQHNYQLWEAGGRVPACQDLCDNLLGTPWGSCTAVCHAALPLVWGIYGRPWSHACVMHRILYGVTLGYIIPLVGLSLKEIMERHEYAQLKGLQVENLGASLALELPVVLKMVAMSIMAAVVCFRGV